MGYFGSSLWKLAVGVLVLLHFLVKRGWSFTTDRKKCSLSTGERISETGLNQKQWQWKRWKLWWNDPNYPIRLDLCCNWSIWCEMSAIGYDREWPEKEQELVAFMFGRDVEGRGRTRRRVTQKTDEQCSYNWWIRSAMSNRQIVRFVKRCVNMWIVLRVWGRSDIH